MNKVAYPNCYFSFFAPRESNILLPSEIKTIGDHLRKVRIERGQYQSDLARMFRVSTDTVTNWELNRNKIFRVYLPIIEDYLGYLPQEFALSDLAKKLIRYRWEHNLSIKEAAKLIGVDYTILTRAELREQKFQKPTFQKLINFVRDMSLVI